MPEPDNNDLSILSEEAHRLLTGLSKTSSAAPSQTEADIATNSRIATEPVEVGPGDSKNLSSTEDDKKNSLFEAAVEELWAQGLAQGLSPSLEMSRETTSWFIVCDRQGNDIGRVNIESLHRRIKQGPTSVRGGFPLRTESHSLTETTKTAKPQNHNREINQSAMPRDEPLFFSNIRIGTATKLWSSHIMHTPLYLLGGALIFVISAIRGEGWGLAIATLVVSGISLVTLPLNMEADKRRNSFRVFYAARLPFYLSRSRYEMLNLVAYFFVVSYILVVLASLFVPRGHNIEVFIIPLAFTYPFIYWQSSTRHWLARTALSLSCFGVALVSLFIFYAGAFNYAPMQNMMGVRAFRDGSYKESVELYTQAISINPRNSLYFTNRAKAHRALRDNKSALNDCKRALNLDPKNENALKLLAKLRAGQ